MSLYAPGEQMALVSSFHKIDIERLIEVNYSFYISGKTSHWTICPSNYYQKVSMTLIFYYFFIIYIQKFHEIRNVYQIIGLDHIFVG